MWVLLRLKLVVIWCDLRMRPMAWSPSGLSPYPPSQPGNQACSTSIVEAATDLAWCVLTSTHVPAMLPTQNCSVLAHGCSCCRPRIFLVPPKVLTHGVGLVAPGLAGSLSSRDFTDASAACTFKLIAALQAVQTVGTCKNDIFPDDMAAD
jgi:hypothetical protein